jgi:RimJ/RimL family protein N-acetyltransferase
MRMLETERLLLKPVEEADLKELLEMQWDRNLMQYMNFKPLSFENQKDWLKSLGKNNMAFSIFLKSENSMELIGLTTLNNIDSLHQRASWGMKLKSNIQSKGVGFEASVILLHFGFSHLNLNKIHGDILFDNIANRKMCSKIGVIEEGVLMKHYFQNGKFRDVVIVGILRDEFYNKNTETIKNLGLY